VVLRSLSSYATLWWLHFVARPRPAPQAWAAADPQRCQAKKGMREQMNTEKTLKEPPLSLSEAWEKEAKRWATWARKPGHDSYWQFHRDQFFSLLPGPGMLTVDVRCGEGRVTRDLKRLGHKVIGIDASATLIRLAREEDPKGKYFDAPASCMPLEDACADLAIAFMSLQDVDDLEPSVLEIARVLQNGGRICLAIVHPINSAGKFASEAADSEFIIKDSYLEEYRYSDWFERAGLEMTFYSQHRPLERYSRALEQAGMVIEAIREHRVPDHAASKPAARRWQRLPLFMHIRAFKLTR
jgi:ubiquinone/menaquinone biosynthesis C-methylase UbiE